MTNQNHRPGSSDGNRNQPAEKERRHESGGNMGAGQSGDKNFGAEKPEERDNAGSRQANRR